MPSATPRWHFGPFILDPSNACLWRDAEAVALSPKAFDVLHYLVTLLQQHAPTWLVQMPWLLNAAHREQLRDELQGVTRERMLREFAEVIDALTAVTPLLLILEDTGAITPPWTC